MEVAFIVLRIPKPAYCTLHTSHNWFGFFGVLGFGFFWVLFYFVLVQDKVSGIPELEV